MKSALPLFTLVVALASCTTAYKSAQTPDDVYFSLARPHAAQDEYVRSNDRSNQYHYDEQSDDDRYLRMKVRNRRTWSDLDYYYSDPFAYNYYNPYTNYYSPYASTPWNYYSSWNYYYNPYSYYSPYSSYYSYNPYVYNRYGSYGSKVIIGNARPPVYNHPRTFNLNVYNPQATNSGNRSSRRVYSGDNRNYDYNSRSNSYDNSNRNSGSSLRNIFNNNNSSNSSSSPSRSSVSTPSSSPSRSSSSGSTNAPVRRF